MPREQAELACLLVSEVVTNVVLHTADRAAARGAGSRWSPAGTRGPMAGASPRCVGEGGAARGTRAAPASSSRCGCAAVRAAVWVEVFDTDLRLPRIRSAEENDEGGRGLYLVDQLATRWGSRPTKDGKAVWFEMPVSQGTAAD